MEKIFKDLKVIELANVLAGPAAGMFFAELGAEVIKIEKTGPVSYTGTFKLSIKNVTKEVKIPYLFLKTAEKTEIKGSFKINRLDYSVGEDSFTLSDDVTVQLHVNLSE